MEPYKIYICGGMKYLAIWFTLFQFIYDLLKNNYISTITILDPIFNAN